MGDYRKLDVWNKSRLLVVEAYRLTQSFPSEERYGLKAQIRSSSVSIMANLAEGRGRNRDRELARFIGIALGSATELESHLVAARDLLFLEAKVAGDAVQRTKEVRPGLQKRLGNN